ncbi:Cryptochrome DASH chloroplastic/mitochondrial [Melia azedarach]|uniref:Cryptochrome DASH chloroplastic/mitochondrial n=1 Tax=Melia azedarach TaxID=155640 RepID=A0ACC1XBL3_MELAZ|nr:Cryptochrome DASH chloroplastic/mitochondrial [Melia azedarach]
MAYLRNSLSSISLKNLSLPSKPTPKFGYSSFTTMGSSSKGRNTSLNIQQKVIYQVPEVDYNGMERIVDETFGRYLFKALKRNGKGISIVWFRNDLRVLDNEVLFKAWVSSEKVLPVYCVDPRLFQTTYYFGFQKTGALRAQFLMECLADLRTNLMNRGLNLLIQHGRPEEIIPSLAESFGAHTVYAQKETCSEEINVERLVRKNLQQVVLSSQSEDKFLNHPKLQLIWSATLYHMDDIPFNPGTLPDVYTQFRKSVEAKCIVRGCVRIPTSLGPPPSVGDWGSIPSVDQLGLQLQKVSRGMKFVGGESAALSRVHEYFWKQDLLSVYKETRNGMLGPDYSTKFSPWLASGSISPRYIYEEVKRYECERLANQSTYWVLFELIWRDYFRFISLKYGNSLFHLGGPRKLEYKWSQDQKLFESWKDGCTGYPLVDANMKELSTTGFMSNRGRQIVCSFLVRDMGIDWRMGAEWFECCLLDYDPCSNYGNWTYGAGVGNDPREDRYFSIPKQAETYDPEGEYVAYWLPQLKELPKDKRNFPGRAYIDQVVPLKHGNINRHRNQDKGFARTGGRSNFGGKQTSVQR